MEAERLQIWYMIFSFHTTLGLQNKSEFVNPPFSPS